MTELRYLEDVVTLECNQDKCIGCSMCTVVCPHGVILQLLSCLPVFSIHSRTLILPNEQKSFSLTQSMLLVRWFFSI